MTLLTPLGLWGLLGIIALIIIYILKPKYQDKSLSSTFIWKLSLKYKRQRTPFEWLKSSLILILQLSIITIISILLANPHVVLGTKSGEKIVILDASASMLATQNGQSRFDRAVIEIGALADLTTPEHRFTVILAGEEASYVVRRSNSAEFIKQNLSTAASAYAGSNMESAMELAESVLFENPTAEVFYYTSIDFNDPGEVNVINMSAGEWNAAILNFSGSLQSNGYYMFTAQIASYGQDATFAVELKVDGVYKSATMAYDVNHNTKTITWSDVQVLSYDNAEINIQVNDSFPYDNQMKIYGGNPEQFKIQILTHDLSSANSTKFFVKTAIENINSNFRIDETIDANAAATTGYDVYVYDGVVPNVLPVDGAIWIFNPQSLPASTGLVLGNTIEGSYTMTAQPGLTDTGRQLMRLIKPSDITVSKYRRIDSYPLFERIMLVGNDPVLLSKNDNGVKISVFPFDLAFSNLPILINFPLLMNNLVNYSVVPTFDAYRYNTGETIDLHAKPSATIMVVESEHGTETFTNFPASIKANRPGSYTVTQLLSSSDVKVESFYVRIPEEESNFNTQGQTIFMPIIPVDPNDDISISNDLLNMLPFLAAGLLLLLLIEWGVQYREQY